MGIKNSILKEVLNSKNCSVGKYLSLMNCSIDNDTETEFYITPVATASRNDVLIISRLITDNWYETVQSIGSIVNYLKKIYGFKIDNYILILHAFFNNAELEKFYRIKPEENFYLQKLNFFEFEKLMI